MDGKAYELTVVSDGISRVVAAKKGDILREVLILNGFFINSPCAGKGICKKCTVMVNGKAELSCMYNVNGNALIELKSEKEVSSDASINATGRFDTDGFFALDIGTTTIAMALISYNGDIAEVTTCNNPQRKYGADVISRIDAVSNGKLNELESEVTAAINKMLESFRARYSTDKVKKIYVAGNMTMLHILFGVDCTSIGTAPYATAFLSSKTVNASDIGIDFDGKVISLPGIHAFAGGDLVAGISTIPIPDEKECNILIDFGTNAEIALITHSKVLCTSAAAGPCFEGGNITCGTSAQNGAIDTFKINNGVNEYTTVGNKAPTGICGTGLIDVFAEMLKKKIVDKTGLMINADEFKICDGVYITQQDIREFQLAKSTIKSGILTLLDVAGMKEKDICKVYLSGGFSAKINAENTEVCGIIPDGLKTKCISVGNSSLTGLIRFANCENSIHEIVNKSEYVDLSANSDFAQRFMDNMYF